MGQIRNATYWINKLELTAHVEGGAFREVYRSAQEIPQSVLPSSFSGNRSFSTSIYFLLQAGQFSALHRIAADEIWHFYAGDPLSIYAIDENGALTEHLLGNDPEKGQSFQCCIKAGLWFGSRVATGGEYSLCGCTVAPGFDFSDFELADRGQLQEIFPQHAALIQSLTYPAH